ncbi:hypothetical protein [Persicobacter psychrovividus]|uniref:Uncharacterized protein n=1 Tax=Persicobacter psychrovividus TaxID=387638 RepID=A0ABM7VCC3_9BACT|nr:hypothetical protein PEPS_06620 [Persicobacter psychrovividus]
MRYLLFFLLIIFLFAPAQVWAQTKASRTSATEAQSSKYLAKKHRSKQNQYSYIIKKNSKKTLYGNPCFTQATHNMGFEYLIMPKGRKPYKNEWQRFWQNFGVKTKLFFTRGPWWKLKLNKQFKECQIQTGDYNPGI